MSKLSAVEIVELSMRSGAVVDVLRRHHGFRGMDDMKITGVALEILRALDEYEERKSLTSNSQKGITDS